MHYCKGLAATLHTDRARPAAMTSEETKLPEGQQYRAEVFYRPSEEGKGTPDHGATDHRSADRFRPSG